MNKKIFVIVILGIFLLSSFNVVGMNIKTQNTENQSFIKDNLGPLDADSECWLVGWNHVETEGDWKDVIVWYIPGSSYKACLLSEGSGFGSATYEFNIWGSEVTKARISYHENVMSPLNSGPSLYIYNYKSEEWDTIKENIGRGSSGVNISINYKDGYIKPGDTNTPDKVRIKVYAEEDWSLLPNTPPLAGDETEVIGIGIYYKSRPNVPDLECENNSIDLGGQEPNSKVDGVIKIKNVGDYQSKLNWRVYSYPEWGTGWTFDPSRGTDLTPQNGIQEIKFSVIVPETTGFYSGRVRIVNTENSDDFEEIMIALKSDNPPTTPTLKGKSNGKVGKEYEFTATSTDSDGHKIFYKFDWGNGVESEWLGPYDSGATCTESHQWATAGTYSVKVMAKDEYGAISEWSDPLPVKMSKSKSIVTTGLFEKLTNLFPNLSTILKNFF